MSSSNGFGRYAADHLWVARHQPGTLAGATEARRAAVCAAEQCTREEYLERESAFISAIIARRPQDVLDLGDYADALLCAYASRVAWGRYASTGRVAA